MIDAVATNLQPIQRPSGLWVPGQPANADVGAVPGETGGFSRTGSGLIVPARALHELPRPQLLVVTDEVRADDVLAAARDAYAQTAASQGAAAAEIMHGNNLRVAETTTSDLFRAAMIEALRAGAVSQAATYASEASSARR